MAVELVVRLRRSGIDNGVSLEVLNLMDARILRRALEMIEEEATWESTAEAGPVADAQTTLYELEGKLRTALDIVESSVAEADV